MCRRVRQLGINLGSMAHSNNEGVMRRAKANGAERGIWKATREWREGTTKAYKEWLNF